MTHQSNTPAWLAAVLLAFAAAPALAQHADIELGGGDGTHLEVEEPHHGEIWHSLSTNANSSFGHLGSNFWQTEFPGFEHEGGLLTPDAAFSLTALDRLYYYHPTNQSFFADTPGGEILQVTKGLEDFAWTDSGLLVNNDVNSDGAVSIATVDNDGNLHAHVDFTLTLNGGDDEPADGAYLASFVLSTSDDGATDPIWALWNKGLGDSDFEGAIAAAEAFVIPEPSSALLVGVAGLALLRRRGQVRSS